MATPLNKKDSSQPQPSKGSPASMPCTHPLEDVCPMCSSPPASGEHSDQPIDFRMPEETRYPGYGRDFRASKNQQRTEPRGQQQEWAYEKGHPADIWIICIGGFPKCSVQGESVAKLICDAHNAELADEREERAIIEHSRDAWKSQVTGLTEALAAEREKYKFKAHLTKEIVELKQQLLAERQRREQAEVAHERAEQREELLSKQLLSALAAIEKHNTDHVDDSFCCIDVDLSALHKHDEKLKLKIWREAPDQPDIQESVIAKLDLVHRHAIEKAVAEVREPLVKALEQLSKLCTPPVDERDRWHWTGKIFCDAVKEICDDALVKVKEQ